MSNLHDSLSERSVDLNRPSTAHSSTSQPVRTKSSVNNMVKEKKVSPSKKSPKNSAQQKQEEPKNTVKASVNDIVGQIQDLNVSNNTNDPEQVDRRELKRRKNARKKERLKQFHVPKPDNMLISQNGPSHSVLGEMTPVQEYFRNSITPLYASSSSRYLENLCHHPQLQIIHNIPVGDMYRPSAMSVPNTPLIYTSDGHGFASAGNSPQIQSVPNTPKFLQNVMQHPLLSKTYYTMGNHNFGQKLNRNMSVPQDGSDRQESPRWRRRNNKNKEENGDDKKFEPYMSSTEVDEGLKNNVLIEGVLRINPKQFQHSYVSSTDRSEQDILIDGLKYRNRALEGDLVVVQLLEDSDNDDNNESISSECTTTGNTKSKNTEAENIVAESTAADNTAAENTAAEYTAAENTASEKTTAENIAAENITTENTTTVKTTTNESKQKKGKVVYIKEKNHNRTCIGNLKLMIDKNRQKALFVPRDHRIPRLNIPFSCWPDNFYHDSKRYENTLFLAKIEDWFDTRFAVGKIVCNIGQSGEIMSEIKAILAQTDLDVTPYGPEVRHLYPRLDYKIPDEELSIREDCRNLCLFSIDPCNCRDIDDAVSCVKLENGNYEIGVHISDVSHFLTENTLLDEKVADKATTIYLVERAYHMLPDDLCMLCSLFPGVDKLAFSVFWEIDDDANVLSHRFAKTVINSCCQLSYDNAQAVLDNSPDAEQSFPELYNGFEYKDVREVIKTLGKISALFRQKRFESGALRIDQPKVHFQLDPSNGLPEQFWIYEIKESHQLIEEFMLLANMTVAKKIHDDFPALAFLRCHPPPSGYMLKQLAKSLQPMGIDLEVTSAGEIHKSLMRYVNTEDKGRAMVLNMLCAKPMTRAKYFCASGCDDDDFHHYALNVPLYTHFTSPIRRYADIMVHRLLSASVKFRDAPNWEVDKVRMIAAQCNKQKYNAKKAGEMAIELYTLKYIEMNSPVMTDAVVVEIRDKYIDTIVVAMGLNRRIFFNNDFPGEFVCIKNDAGAKLSKMEVTWKATEDSPEVKHTIEVFSILKVELVKGDDMVKVETRLVRPQ